MTPYIDAGFLLTLMFPTDGTAAANQVLRSVTAPFALNFLHQLQAENLLKRMEKSSESGRQNAGRQARRLCPHVIVVEPHMSAYSEASKAVFEVFADTTPLVEGRAREDEPRVPGPRKLNSIEDILACGAGSVAGEGDLVILNVVNGSAGDDDPPSTAT